MQDHGSRAGDLRCVELSFFNFVRQLDPAQRYFRIPERLKPQHRITSLRRLPVILLNQVIQVLVGPDERFEWARRLRPSIRRRLDGTPDCRRA
jgi:hypothetical protein